MGVIKNIFIMKTKMSLDAFKMQAENKNVELALESVQGGGLFNCHGKSGQFGKKAAKLGVTCASAFCVAFATGLGKQLGEGN